MDSRAAEAILQQRCASRPRGIYAVATTLQHFAIITYAIPPERLLARLPPGFTPHLVRLGDEDRALISVVPFLDRDFHFVRLPLARWSFAQTNYRAYVRYRGEECAWFFGTALATPLVQIPRQLWQLPWLPAETRFDARFDREGKHYERYVVETSGSAALELALEDFGEQSGLFPGFDCPVNQELVIGHPTQGYFCRRDGRLGTYRIWHDRLKPTRGKVVHARYKLLEDLGILSATEAQQPHSVLIQREVDFLIDLPPRCLPVADCGRGARKSAL